MASSAVTVVLPQPGAIDAIAIVTPRGRGAAAIERSSHAT
jgi:hypothetical protein